MGLSGGDGTRNLTTMQNKTEQKSTETCASIKLGIDVGDGTKGEFSPVQKETVGQRP